MSNLAEGKCDACENATQALSPTAVEALLNELGRSWQIVRGHHLEKTFTFKDFLEALDFTNKIGAVAETEGHHPDIYLTWGKVRIEIFTHKVDGLTRADFVLAAKFDRVKAG